MSAPQVWADLLAAAAANAVGGPRRICDLCVQRLDISGAGVSVVTAGDVRTVVCSTDERSTRMEDLQFTLGEGPCVDAVVSGTPILVPDLRDPADLAVDRWPTFLADVEAMGVRAVFAFPLRIGAISIGALDLYRDRPGVLHKGQLAAAWGAANSIAAVLLRAHPSDQAAADDALQPVTYEIEVHQATGMVQAQLGISTREALLRLRAHAFAEGRQLREIAHEVIARRLRFTPEDTHD